MGVPNNISWDAKYTVTPVVLLYGNETKCIIIIIKFNPDGPMITLISAVTVVVIAVSVIVIIFVMIIVVMIYKRSQMQGEQ